jgi:YhcH/YjgK/YiaL family protein
MIFDHLKNAHLYYVLGPRFEKGLRYLQETDLTKMEPGKHPIDGDDLFLVIKRYDSFPVAECKLENHHKYADIQFVISGKEWFCYAPLDNLKEVDPHPENDVYYFQGACEPLTMTGDLFAIVLPDDAHMPERAINEKREPIHKAIVKVRL